MAVFFSGSELLEIAKNIERNGMAFYQALADRVANRDARASYNYLAGEEKKHLDTFQGMSDDPGQYKPDEIYTEEYTQYIKSLIGAVVFPSITEAQQKAEKASNDVEAVNMGIQAEKDSILFYTELRDLVRERDQEVILTVLNEEKKHLRQLLELKTGLM